MPAHRSALAFDLSGFGLGLDGLPTGVARRLGAHWERFATGREVPLDLELSFEVSGPPMPDGDAMTPGIRSLLARDRARYEIAEGAIEIDASGRGRARVAPGDEGRQLWAAINLAAAGVGWHFPFRGGGLLHAAAVVLDGRAFVLVGPEGAGKSTWARLVGGAGGTVLSDDVVAVEVAESGAEVLSTPFRTETLEPVGPGRWPLAALLLPAHGPRAALAPVSRLALAARLAANLLYLTAAPPDDPRPRRVLDALAGSIPARALTFGLDPGFVPLLRRFAP